MSMSVVVTGANRGIGLSFCKYFHSCGKNVIGVCRKSSADLEKVADKIICDVDIANHSACEILFKKLSQTRIDILINNAGILLNEQLGNIDFNSIEKQVNANAIGSLRVTEGLINNLCKNSKVALITSRMGSIADNSSGGRYGYRMSKAALNAAGKSLAIDLKPKKIFLGIYHPGFVKTEMTAGNGNVEPDEAAQRIALLIDKLDHTNSGKFWHSNGEILPW